MSGHLNSKYSPAVRERFLNTQTVADITTLMEEFADAVKKGDYREKGWPGAAYAVSKSGMLSYLEPPLLVRMQGEKGLGRERKKKRKQSKVKGADERIYSVAGGK